jgi:hypothetical protein
MGMVEVGHEAHQMFKFLKVFYVIGLFVFIGIVIFKLSTDDKIPTTYEFISDVRESLPYPDSANFRNEFVASVTSKNGVATHYMCAEVNAISSPGTYAGFKRVIAGIVNGIVVIDDGSPTFEEIWQTQCNRKIASL